MDHQDRRIGLANISAALAPTRRTLAIYDIEAPNISPHEITHMTAVFPRLSCKLWVSVYVPAPFSLQEPLAVELTDFVLDQHETKRARMRVYRLCGSTVDGHRPFEARFYPDSALGMPRGVLVFSDAVEPTRLRKSGLPTIVWH